MRSHALLPRFVAALSMASCLSVGTGHAETLECGDQASDFSRIVVAGGSLVEILYELNRADTIVAVDTTANYPEEATALPQIGYVRNLSAEGLLSLQPTLILGEHDMGPPAVVEQLEALNIDMLMVPERFDAEGIRDKVRCVAAVVGAGNAGERMIDELLGGSLSLVSGTQAGAAIYRGVVLLGLRSGTPMVAGTNTSGDGLLTMAGASNLFSFEGWKPVSVEAMAAAQPSFIVIPNRGVEMAGGLESLLQHPALRLTPAATARRVISMDGMAMLGFGPRTVKAATSLRETLIEMQAHDDSLQRDEQGGE